MMENARNVSSKNMTKKEKIKELSQKKYTPFQIASKCAVSTSYVYQILSGKETPTPDHIRTEYKKNIFDILQNELLPEALRLSRLGRDEISVMQKQIFVSTLLTHYKFSYVLCGELLKKDHSTIINLYDREQNI